MIFTYVRPPVIINKAKDPAVDDFPIKHNKKQKQNSISQTLRLCISQLNDDTGRCETSTRCHRFIVLSHQEEHRRFLHGILFSAKECPAAFTRPETSGTAVQVG